MLVLIHYGITNAYTYKCNTHTHSECNGSILTARRGSQLIYDYWIWKRRKNSRAQSYLSRVTDRTLSHTRIDTIKNDTSGPLLFFFHPCLYIFFFSSSSSSSTCWTADERLPKEKHKEREREREPVHFKEIFVLGTKRQMLVQVYGHYDDYFE